MNENCPKCGNKVGWLGPRSEVKKISGTIRSSQRFFCRACGVELQLLSKHAENVARAVGFVGLGLGSLANLHGHLTGDILVPNWLIASVFCLSAAAFLVMIFLALRKQHYVVADANLPINADATGPST
jgi:hypothetical protein